MKILRIAISIPPYPGGMENHIKQLTIEQLKLGHSVDIFFLRGSKISSSDVKFHLSWIFNLKPQFIRYFFFYFLVIVYLLIRRKKYDVIHLHGDWSSFIFGPFIKKITTAKVIATTYHGSLNSGIIKKCLLIFSLKKSNVCFFNGYEVFSAMRGCCNAIFQPSGVNSIFRISDLSELNNKIYDVVTVAYFRPEKNLYTFLNVAKALPQYTFCLIGYGPQSQEIDNYIKKQKMKNLLNLGKLTQLQIKDILQQSKIFLFTSLKEGTPTVLMEAMSVGLPIVSSDVSGIKYFIKPRINAIYVENPFDVSKYCTSLIDFLSSDYKLSLFSYRNLFDSKNFDWSLIAQRITSKYGL